MLRLRAILLPLDSRRAGAANFGEMRVEYERVDPGVRSSFAAFEVEARSFDHRLHYHPEVEIAHILRGRGALFCGSQSSHFAGGDLFLFASNVPHRFISRVGPEESPCRARVVQFREDAFGERLFEAPELASVRALLERASGGFVVRHAGEPLAARLERVVAGAGLARLTALLELLRSLAGESTWKTVSRGGLELRERGDDERRMIALQELISSYYLQALSLDDASRALNLTRGAACRFIRRVTGTTFTHLLNNYRLAHAGWLLRDTTRPITEVALEAGFRSLSYFNQRFRERYGTTPREYRAAWWEATA